MDSRFRGNDVWGGITALLRHLPPLSVIRAPFRHPREGGDPSGGSFGTKAGAPRKSDWIPACAGMTGVGVMPALLRHPNLFRHPPSFRHPAKAGIHAVVRLPSRPEYTSKSDWIPAFAGMTTLWGGNDEVDGNEQVGGPDRVGAGMRKCGRDWRCYMTSTETGRKYTAHPYSSVILANAGIHFCDARVRQLTQPPNPKFKMDSRVRGNDGSVCHPRRIFSNNPAVDPSVLDNDAPSPRI